MKNTKMPEHLKSLGHHKTSQDQIDKIIKLHQTQGLDHIILAERFGMNRNTIRGIIERHKDGKNG